MAVFRNAVATPTKRITAQEIAGGVYDDKLQLIGDSIRPGGPDSEMRHVDPPSIEEPAAAEFLRGRTCYIGHIFGEHYGHFITEGISSLWWPAGHRGEFDQIAVQPFLFGSRRSAAEIAVWKKLALDNVTMHVIKRVTRFEELVVPERIWHGDHSVNQIYRQLLDRLTSPYRRQPSRDVYLSRSKVPLRRIANESGIEAIFQARGFDVVHPQELAFEAQLSLYGTVRTLAGFAGSNLHNSLLCPPGATVVSLQDFRETVRPNQLVCSALMTGETVGIPTKRDHDVVELTDLRCSLDALG